MKDGRQGGLAGAGLLDPVQFDAINRHPPLSVFLMRRLTDDKGCFKRADAKDKVLAFKALQGRVNGVRGVAVLTFVGSAAVLLDKQEHVGRFPAAHIVGMVGRNGVAAGGDEEGGGEYQEYFSHEGFQRVRGLMRAYPCRA